MKIGLQNFQRMQVPFWGILIFVTICSGTVPAMAKTPLFEAYKRVIVLDPGHGGREFGARGPDGTSEKTVTLALARLIAAELEQDFKVALTRTDDYHVDLDNRTGLANHLKADVFISFHTGGSFVYSTTGTIIYYYQNVTESSSIMEENPVFQGNGTNRPIEWDHVQNSYLKKSRALARMINKRLNRMNSIQKKSGPGGFAGSSARCKHAGNSA